MSRIIRFCNGLLFLVALLGCNQKDPLIGKWVMPENSSSAEMELADDSTLHFGDNNGTWQKIDNSQVILKMESGVYTAEVRKNILSFNVAGMDVVFVKKN